MNFTRHDLISKSCSKKGLPLLYVKFFLFSSQLRYEEYRSNSYATSLE